MEQLGWVGLTLTVPLIKNPDSQRLLFWLYTWWLYEQFSPKKWRCYLFKEALEWLVLFLEVVRFYNINHFLRSKIFSWAFGFGFTHHPSLQRSGNVRKPLLNLDNIFRWICIDILCRCISNLNSAIYFWDIVILGKFATILILSNFFRSIKVNLLY